MPHEVSLITTIAAALGVALVSGFFAAKLKLPPLVGYLVAGILIGPATPGFVADISLAAQLSEIGVMLLMFGVGLHFSLDDLLAVRRIAVPGALGQMAVATALGTAVGLSWGWQLGGALVFGLSLSVASTVVLLKALDSRGALKTVNGQIAVGWLVVEDLATVLVLVILPPLAGVLGGNHTPVPGESLSMTILSTLALVIAFIVFMLVVGRRVLPWILWKVASTGSRELFTLCVVAAAVSIAYGSTKLFGVSFALGAFFAGMVMRDSPLSHRAAEESLPLRDAFAVLFFVSVGMLFKPAILVEQPWQVVAVVAIIMYGKTLAAALLVLAFRYSLNTALTVSASLAQIGEFSFILAALGVKLGLLPEAGLSLILAGSLISIALNPLIFKTIDPVLKWVGARPRLARFLDRQVDALAELPASVDQRVLSGQIVLVGYGRVGRRIGKALSERGVPFVVAEENREIVEKLRRQGIPAVSGNAAEPATLIQAHIARASMLVIATPNTMGVRKMIKIARTLNPAVMTVIRAHSDEEAALLEQENAGKVFLGERELASGITRYVLEQLEQRAVQHAESNPG